MSNMGPLAKKADRSFSLYIRQRDGWRCVLCGDTERKRMTCGHLFARGPYSTRWDVRNAFCQCSPCNGRHEHNPHIFTLWYIQQFGQQQYERLWQLHNQLLKLTFGDVRNIERRYLELYMRLDPSRPVTYKPTPQIRELMDKARTNEARTILLPVLREIGAVP